MSGVMSRSAKPALKTGFDGPAAVAAPGRTREIARESVQRRSVANKVISFRVREPRAARESGESAQREETWQGSGGSENRVRGQYRTFAPLRPRPPGL